MVQMKLSGGPVKTYPKECTTKSSSGKVEARVFEERGEYLKYGYEDVETGKVIAKYSLLLKNENGEYDHLMIVPTKEGKEYVVYHKKGEHPKKVYDTKNNRIIEL